MQFRALTWTTIVSFGLFCSPAILTCAHASTNVPTTLSLSPGSSTIAAGGSVTFTATILDKNTSAGLSGLSIDLNNLTSGVDLIGGFPLTDANGMASLMDTFPTAGIFTLQAIFEGAGFDSPSQSNQATVTVNQTPLPAALPLFATGIGGLGLLGWRRKRKAQADA
jgi:hypothetical protein